MTDIILPHADSGIGLIYDSVTMSSYTVVESAGTLLVCIRANNTVNEEFSVTLSTFSAGSATGKLIINEIAFEKSCNLRRSMSVRSL